MERVAAVAVPRQVFLLFFFNLRNGTTESGCLRQRPLEKKETGHSAAPNYTTAPSDGGAGLISLVGLVDS